ncbi:retron Ec78 anti-phage system effector ATPase PtuA [Shewanella acanthi]|uniref:retron Ec78 anti-phage system effector ATPase PtuA n=1 Tax=Shewanella acanthi TaxID=2864212 RepID=UPI001C65CEF7|nr:retron Ec78 anti-phage system effector ATPase PtuA [Shewanella acanthi]QYJ79857.1 AAA family ATPase [Shewanella acanthi]
MNTKTKNTKELERKARKGELLSAFQLYLNYKDGLDDVIVDSNLSKKYLQQCIDYIENIKSNSLGIYLPKNKLTLVNIELFDLRVFKHLKMSFEPDLTVIIGNNGQGKTTILNAISKTLSWINANILKEEGQGQRLSELYDIRRGTEKDFTDVLSEFNFGSGLKRINARLSRSKLGASSRRESDIKNLREISNIFRIINEIHLLNLPLCAYYSVDRSYQLQRTTKDNANLRDERFDAYNFSLVGSGKFEHFVEWFISLHKKTVNDNTAKIEELEQQVKALNESVKSGITALIPLLETTQKQLDDALAILERANDNSFLSDATKKEIVVAAICKVIPSISNIWVETESGSDIVFVTNDSVDITIEQLSDGQRTFLGLIADLVRRLVMLNPKLNNPLEGQGIVLIDEIELHLHPKWQQDVLLDLKNCFPNIQFIISTHSPLVLSTVDRKNIRYFSGFDINGGTIIEAPDYQTKGILNSDILEQLMGTFAKPARVEESHWLEKFEKMLIAADYSENEDAKSLYGKIKYHFGEGSFEIQKSDSLIRLQAMRKKALEKSKK